MESGNVLSSSSRDVVHRCMQTYSSALPGSQILEILGEKQLPSHPVCLPFIHGTLVLS